MPRKNKKSKGRGWHGDSLGHSMAAKGQKVPWAQHQNKIKKQSENMEKKGFQSKRLRGTEKQKIDYIKQNYPPDYYVRFIDLKNGFGEEKFINSKSGDYERIYDFLPPVKEGYVEKYQKEEISKEELLEASFIPEYLYDNIEIERGRYLDVDYDGLHAYQIQHLEHEPYGTLEAALKYSDKAVIFKGETIGRNIWDDGYIVKPQNVVVILENDKGDQNG